MLFFRFGQKNTPRYGLERVNGALLKRVYFLSENRTFVNGKMSWGNVIVMRNGKDIRP